MTTTWGRRAAVFCGLVLTMHCLVPLNSAALPAENAAATGRPAESFSALVEKHTAALFEAVQAYAAANPDAADIDAARRWLLQTAVERGLEVQAAGVAQSVLDNPGADQTLRPLALRVKGVGLARSGKLAEAMEVLDGYLASVSIRSPNEAVDFALALVAQAQLAGEGEAAAQILDRISEKFFLNVQVRELVERRRVRLALLGKEAPELTVSDLDGTPVRLDEYRGKVVLVDFWGTNCPPCLESFPELSSIYSENREAGFEILGISLDEDVTTVKVFREKQRLPWRMALSSTDREDTRGRYHADTIPATFLVDREGRVAYVDLRGPDLRRAIGVLLGK